MSRRKLDKILILDLEATCWEPKHLKPHNEESEIIEIGACFLDMRTGERKDKTSYYIRPTRSTVSKFCTQLTGITTELLKEKGIPFGDAINKMRKEFGPSQRTWASWGAYDRIELQKNCKHHGIDYPMGPNHINAKNLWAFKQGLSKELGLKRALDHMGMKFEGKQHSGADDAWNIAKLLWGVMKPEDFE